MKQIFGAVLGCQPVRYDLQELLPKHLGYPCTEIQCVLRSVRSTVTVNP